MRMRLTVAETCIVSIVFLGHFRMVFGHPMTTPTSEPLGLVGQVTSQPPLALALLQHALASPESNVASPFPPLNLNPVNPRSEEEETGHRKFYRQDQDTPVTADHHRSFRISSPPSITPKDSEMKEQTISFGIQSDEFDPTAIPEPKLHTISEHFLATLLHHHLDHMDARRLRESSKSMTNAISRASARQYPYHLMCPLSSMIMCMERQHEPCLQYWFARLGEFSRVQAFALAAALNRIDFSERDLMGIEQSVLQLLQTEHLSDWERGTLAYLTVLRKLHLSQIPVTPQLMPDPPMSLETEGEFRYDALQRIREILDGLGEAYRYWSQAAQEHGSNEQKQAILRHMSIYDAMCTLFENTLVDPATRLEDFYAGTDRIYHYFLELWEARLIKYKEYVNRLESEASIVLNLDEIAYDTGYTSDLSPDLPAYMFRVMDQHLFPKHALHLGKVVIRHRRLDFLQTLVQDEDFMSTAKREPWDGGKGTNFLWELMNEMVKNAFTLSHHSWSTLDALRLLLENGGLKLKYPGFLSDLARLWDLETMRYVVRDLGFREGLPEALDEAREGQNESMVALIESFI